MLGAARTITRGADELLVYCAGVNCHIPCPVAKRTRSTLAGGLQTSTPRQAMPSCVDGPDPSRRTPARELPSAAGAGRQIGSSVQRFLHERADPCLVGGGQLLQREGDRPHGAFVEVRLV